MSRSLYKGPYVDERLLKKIAGKKPGEGGVIKTWARNSVISPEMVGFKFGVHNGRSHLEVLVAEEMVGHKFGEFSPTKSSIDTEVRCRRNLSRRRRKLKFQLPKPLRPQVNNWYESISKKLSPVTP